MPTSIVFGAGRFEKVAAEVAPFGADRILLVTGKGFARKSGLIDRTLELLSQYDVVVFEDVEPDPSYTTVEQCAEAAGGCRLVLGVGGGSALDAAKAASALAVSKKGLAELVDDSGEVKKKLPFIAVPTTSGTGTEVTKVAVLTDTENSVKKSFRSPLLFPEVALVDPALTASMPAAVTASSGLDALTHAVEAYVSVKATPVSDALALKSIQLIGGSLEKACRDGDCLEARTAMSAGSLLAGMAFSNVGCGAAHGLSHPLGGAYRIPHGVVNGLLLPYVMKYNLESARGKYGEVAAALGASSPEEGIERVNEIVRKVGISGRLRDFKVPEEKLEWIAENSFTHSMSCNPRPGEVGWLQELLKEAY